MATYDVKYPVCAKLLTEAVSGNTYDTGAFIGKQRTLTVTPNIARQTLSGDGMADAEEIEEFINAPVALETTFIPLAVAAVLFGNTHTAATQSTPETVVDKADDSPNNVGFGCVIKKIENGVRSYCVLWLNKVMFQLPAESVTTKGDSVTFGTPSLTGTAKATVNGEWRTKEFYATEAAAFAALKTKANISDPQTQSST